MPEITEVFYPLNRQQWRDWLQTHHNSGKTEVWLQTYRKATGKPSLPYDDMVEECLCFGWIDGVVKKYDEESSVQRISPRKKKTFLSELNRQRIWKLQIEGLMTPFGVAPIAEQIGHIDDPLILPDWLALRIQRDKEAWENFQNFHHFYKRLKVGWINEITGNGREAEKDKRLDYLIKMSKQGKMYGTQPLKGIRY